MRTEDILYTLYELFESVRKHLTVEKKSTFGADDIYVVDFIERAVREWIDNGRE